MINIGIVWEDVLYQAGDVVVGVDANGPHDWLMGDREYRAMELSMHIDDTAKDFTSVSSTAGY